MTGWIQDRGHHALSWIQTLRIQWLGRQAGYGTVAEGRTEVSTSNRDEEKESQTEDETGRRYDRGELQEDEIEERIVCYYSNCFYAEPNVFRRRHGCICGGIYQETISRYNELIHNKCTALHCVLSLESQC